jgi:SAM-dependent methyltransferase
MGRRLTGPAREEQRMTTTYAFDNAWHLARQRLSALEAMLDPGTIRHLEARGVGPGWHCLEVGAGGGSIADWLCRRVGPDGRVGATDLDTRFLAALDHPNLDVRRHDIVRDELPAATFDLVHLRLVLGHLPERATALRRLVAALRPGGWLVAEGMDCVSVVPAGGDAAGSGTPFARLFEAHHRVLAARGFDGFYGLAAVGRPAGARPGRGR